MIQSLISAYRSASRVVRRVPHLLGVVGLTAATALFGAPAGAWAAGDVVISQIYGGGGNSGATFRNDFIELFNRSNVAVSLSGWSVQYASATGTTWQRTDLSGTLQPGQYYLVQESVGTGGTVTLPTPDASGSIPMSATAGKVALVNSTTLLTCSTGCATLSSIVDLVGYGGTANSVEGAGPAPGLSNTTAASRNGNGCQDTDVNSTDFSAGSPNPRNTASPVSPCGGSATQSIVATCPVTLSTAAGTPVSANLSATDADGVVMNVVITSAAVTGITVTNIVPANAIGGTLTATLSVAATVVPGSYATDLTFTNTDTTAQTALCTVTISVGGGTGVALRIHDIQGAAHLSPHNGETVTNVPGIVTVVRPNGFYMQDPSPDNDPATSEGIFVFTSTAPPVAVGDSVQVRGTVSEFRPGGAGGATNLTITEISSPIVTVVSSGNSLPTAVNIGINGRIPPTLVIDDDATSDVEINGVFDPTNDGIDFYESLEGMLVQINNPVVVGPTNAFGEIPVLADNGANAGLRTARGGIVISSSDFNPERIFLDDAIVAPVPAVNVGDRFASVNAVVDYSFGNFKFLVMNSLTPIPQGLSPEITTLLGTSDRLTVSSFNVENLAPTDPSSKFAGLGDAVVNRLRSPDIIAVEEIQDNSGATNDGVVDATTTFDLLISAIRTAGGPTYAFRNINPVDGQDGGQPGGNIRVGFLFNPARVTFVDRPGGTSTSGTTALNGPTGPQLSVSPGRIDPLNPAFTDSRKPLAGEFQFNGHSIFIIANHFNSKGGDQPLFGRFQPPVRLSETQRQAQAQVVHDFVQSLLTLDSQVRVIVLGDLNDFQFSTAVTTLKGGGILHNLVGTLPVDEQYTYIFEGNAQVLDHILISPGLMNFALPEYDIVHMNAEFTTQLSDHDPAVACLNLPPVQDVTAEVPAVSSGLTFNRRTQTFTGTIQITNTSASFIAGPVQVQLQNLTVGVALVNANGTQSGNPYLTVPVSGLAPGASVSVPVQFSNPTRVGISYNVRMFSGSF